MQSLLILGRQPELGLAEIESLYGEDKVELLSPNVVLVDVDPCILAFKRLGGSSKFAKLLTIIESTNWQNIIDFLVEASPKQAANMPGGKMTLGLSAYGWNVNTRDISRDALEIKRSLQASGRSVRIVPNKSADLNTAQIIHNKMTSDRAWELLIIKGEKRTYIGQTIMVQDIESYTARDQARPYRDSRVGMLPPKLAQIIINLAVGKLSEEELKSVCDDEQIDKLPQLTGSILDPFCGSGVVLQEAFLMGYGLVGSDISPRMIEYTKNNLEWLANRYQVKIDVSKIEVGDAQNMKWPPFDYVASEVNLGKPLSHSPTASEVAAMKEEINRLMEKFLANIASQCQPGTRLCLALPAWKMSNGTFEVLPLIDHLSDLMYNLVDFKSIKGSQLIYHRPQQIVGRHLVTIIRK